MASNRRNWLPYILAAVFIVIAVIGFTKVNSKPKGEPVQAEAVGKRTIRETVSGSGKIFPETEVKISSDVSGEVIELYVKEGDSVTVGQILAKIRPDEYQSAVEQGEAAVNTARAQRSISSSNIQSASAQIEQFNADIRRAKAQAEAARNAFQRAEKLYKEGVISTAEYETALNNSRAADAAVAVSEATLKTAESNMANAKDNVKVSDFGINSAGARLKELRTSLQKTIIVAPVSGIVSKLNVEKGERVLGMVQMTGTEMMRIANLSSMEVQVDVVENDILKVALGNESEVEVDAYLGRKFKGKITEIARSASNISSNSAAALNTDQVTNFTVKIRIDPNSYADLVKPGQRYPFLPGMSASVNIFTHTEEGTLSVPLMAVTARQDKEETDKKDKDKAEEENPQAKKVSQETKEIKEIVFVVSGDTVAVREIKTGIQDNDYIQVLSGLNEGEQVVSGPYSAISNKLESGSRIRIEEKEKKKN
jgi:HlyD family secretion protein